MQYGECNTGKYSTLYLLAISNSFGLTACIYSSSLAIKSNFCLAVVFDVIDNLLNPVNLAGFVDLQEAAPASQTVLNNAERYALFLANASEEVIRLSRENVGEIMV